MCEGLFESDVPVVHAAAFFRASPMSGRCCGWRFFVVAFVIGGHMTAVAHSGAGREPLGGLLGASMGLLGPFGGLVGGLLGAFGGPLGVLLGASQGAFLGHFGVS